MRQIPVQQDDITSLPAEDFNDIPREEENLITSGGIALDDGDLFQMAKAVANYAATGASYVDTGSANLYSLSTLSAQKGLTRYLIGTAVRFKIGNTNTGTACTVDVNSVGAIPIHVGYLANGGTPSVPVGFIVEDETAEVVYDLTPDSITPYFRVRTFSDAQIESMSASKLTVGTISITSSGTEWLQSATGGLSFGVSGNEFGEFTKDQIRLIDNSSSSNSMVSTITETTLTRNSIRMALSGRGCRYSVGPGEATYKTYDLRESAFEFTAGGAWADTSGVGIWLMGLLFLTDIPYGSKIVRVDIHWTTGGQEYVCAAYANTKDEGGGFHTFDHLTCCTGITSAGPTQTFTAVVRYDGSGL